MPARATKLPILRKDFLRTRYEVVQSAAYGADAILAIVAGLDDAQLRAMIEEAAVYALDVLVEVHDEGELGRAIAAGATLLGINNRDLHTFETNLAVTAELLPLVPVVDRRDQRERGPFAGRRAAALRRRRARVLGRRVADARARQGRADPRAARDRGTGIAERTRIKICGNTSVADVEGAVEAGADAVGLILAESSKRITLADVRTIVRAVPSYVAVVAVFVRPSPADVAAALALGAVAQFSGDESPEFCARGGGAALHQSAALPPPGKRTDRTTRRRWPTASRPPT